MKIFPLLIGLGAIIHRNKLVLINRRSKPYQNLWGLPGGKIEGDENLACGLIREIEEETGLKTKLEKYLGVLSELLSENGEIKAHFLLHICLLYPLSLKIKAGEEGIADWFDLRKIEKLKGKIIPSDFLIIKEILKGKKYGYYDCIMEKKKDGYFLKKFEKSDKYHHGGFNNMEEDLEKIGKREQEFRKKLKKEGKCCGNPCSGNCCSEE